MSRPEYELSAPAKLRIIEEGDAKGETAAAYQYCRDTMGRQDVPGLLKMSVLSRQSWIPANHESHRDRQARRS
jgi:hypothetical protein